MRLDRRGRPLFCGRDFDTDCHPLLPKARIHRYERNRGVRFGAASEMNIIDQPGAQTAGNIQEAPHKLRGIEAGRGFAAALVVLAHIGTIIAQPRFYNVRILNGATDYFGVGIDFFFVLSGFVICWVHWDDIGQRGRLRRYAVNRISRIYPPYLIVMLPLAALYFTHPGAGIESQHDPVNLIFSILLLPYPVHPILGVAWTLVHEVLFYLLFGLIIAAGRRALWILPGWGAVILMLALLAGPLPFPFDILLNPFNLEFLLGISAALWLKYGRVPAPAAVALAGAVTFLSAMAMGAYIVPTPLLARAVFGLSSAAYVAGIVELERTRSLTIPRQFLLIGAASYAIYLTHGVVLSAFLNIVFRAWPHIPLPVAIGAMFGFALAIGIGYHLLIEKRAIALVKRLLTTRPSPRSR